VLVLQGCKTHSVILGVETQTESDKKGLQFIKMTWQKYWWHLLLGWSNMRLWDRLYMNGLADVRNALKYLV